MKYLHPNQVVGRAGRPPRGGRGLKYSYIPPCVKGCGRPPRGGRGLKYPCAARLWYAVGSPPSRGAWIEICIGSQTHWIPSRSPPSRGAWIEIAAHTAPRRSRPSPLRPVCPPGAPSCRPEKSSFVPSVVMYPVSFQLFVSSKNSFADFTWPFFSASE